MSLADAEKILGTPYRTVDDPAQNKTQIDQQFRFYGDYTKFSALTVDVGDQPKVIGYYTNYGIENATGHDFTREVDRESNYYAIKAGLSLQNHADDAAEQIIFELTNAIRGFYGIAPLEWNEELAASAHSHSERMAAEGELTHRVLEGELRYEKGWSAENATSSSTAYSCFRNWAVSAAGHYWNLLRSAEEAGVGYYQGYATIRFADVW
jgi:uncharacterized protein YkwD